MPTHTCVEDLRQQYTRRVPRMFVDYAENGSYQEETIKANRRDFEAITFQQRILVDVSQRSTATTLLACRLEAGLCPARGGPGPLLPCAGGSVYLGVLVSCLFIFTSLFVSLC